MPPLAAGGSCADFSLLLSLVGLTAKFRLHGLATGSVAEVAVGVPALFGLG